VQIDALTLDEADTIRRASSFHSDLVTRAASETRALRELGAGLIVGDIPPLAFAVGASAGIPSIGLGNFTWDWIYADYPRVRLAPSLLPTIRGAYAKASMALRLPMSGGFESFSNVRDIPFVARHSTRVREEVLKVLKVPAEKPIVLASFGGYGLPGLDTDTLSKFKKYTVITTATVPMSRARKDTPTVEKKGSFFSINEEAMYDAGVRYEDLMAAAEIVVTKPGYGIISEAIANDTAVLYTSRGHFPEYDVLIEEMPKYVRSAFISHDDLFAGKWESHLDKLRAQPKLKKKPETNGADVAADILLKALDKPPKKPRGRPKLKF
jgi:L-arabinokinase